MMLNLKLRPLPPNARVEILGVIPWSRTQGMWVVIPDEPGFVGLSAEGMAELLDALRRMDEPC